MWHTLVVVMHVVGAIGALVVGFLALLVFPNGTQIHRVLGKLYLISWGLLAVGGMAISMGRPGISVFDVLNILGLLSTAYAYSFVLRRKQLGRIWLRQHYQWMLTSLTFVVVATINQLLPRIGIEYPIWVFYLMVIAPAPFNSWMMRKLDQRYGLAKPRSSQKPEVRSQNDDVVATP